MSNPDFDKMKQECQNQRECMVMLQLIIDGEASPEQKEHFLVHHLGRFEYHFIKDVGQFQMVSFGCSIWDAATGF